MTGPRPRTCIRRRLILRSCGHTLFDGTRRHVAVGYWHPSHQARIGAVSGIDVWSCAAWCSVRRDKFVMQFAAARAALTSSGGKKDQYPRAAEPRLVFIGYIIGRAKTAAKARAAAGVLSLELCVQTLILQSTRCRRVAGRRESSLSAFMVLRRSARRSANILTRSGILDLLVEASCRARRGCSMICSSARSSESLATCTPRPARCSSPSSCTRVCGDRRHAKCGRCDERAARDRDAARHTRARGASTDTLQGLCLRYNVQPQSLLRLNRLPNAQAIHARRTLRLPPLPSTAEPSSAAIREGGMEGGGGGLSARGWQWHSQQRRRR